jgi:hypothetical protein
VEPEDLTVIGHIGDLLADIYAAENGAYLHFTAMLNASGETAQSRRNECSIRTVEVRKLGRNTQYDIPVRYFSFASAEKCAEQLALADMG